MATRTYDPYDEEEFSVQEKIARLEKIARDQGYSFNKSKLKRDMDQLSKLAKKDKTMSEHDRSRELLKIYDSVEDQMLGKQQMGGKISLATLGLRKKKSAKPKTKRCKCK